MFDKRKRLLYLQLKDKILEDYSNKPYYSPLPGERRLCDIYEVSRPTVRKALEILEEEGCIAKIPDKGVFFVGNNAGKNADKQIVRATNISFYNQVRLNGDIPVSKIITQKIIEATEEVAEKLRIPVGAPVFYLERLRYINTELCTISSAYIPYELCPELMEHTYEFQSLHNVLSGYGHVPVWANRKLMAVEANEYDAKMLKLEVGAPICIAKTVSYDANDYPLEYSVNREDFRNMSIDIVLKNSPNADERERHVNVI